MGVTAINSPWWRSNYNMAIKHWNGRCAKDGCASRDTVVQKEQNKYCMGIRDRWAVYRWAMNRCSDL